MAENHWQSEVYMYKDQTQTECKILLYISVIKFVKYYSKYSPVNEDKCLEIMEYWCCGKGNQEKY